ncbi:MAG: hypothetical protein GDA36_11730 [Rhodobacteraceae bacterium]|nr:hypothetical protein [Paracoccaceae bacterium]
MTTASKFVITNAATMEIVPLGKEIGRGRGAADPVSHKTATKAQRFLVVLITPACY